MLLISLLQRSIFSYHQQTTSPDITVINPPNYLKAPVVIKFTRIICCYKGTGINISEIDDVENAFGRES